MTSPDHEEEAWSSHTEPRSPFTPRHISKKRRTAPSVDATQEFGLMRDGGPSEPTRFIGSGSGIHFIRAVYDVLARSTAKNHTAIRSRAVGDLVPGEDDQILAQTPGDASTAGISIAHAPFWLQHEIIPDGEPEALPANFDNLVQWTKSYFENWHAAFPFLHGPEVLEVFEMVEKSGIAGVSRADATIVRAMVSISLADARQLAPYKQPIPASLVLLSQEDITLALAFFLGCPASLKNVQAAVCVQLFLVSILKFNMASRLGGMIVRMSFHLGLHRCPARYPNFSVHDGAMRKRIWWSIYCLERMVCHSLGHPLDIADDDADVCMPGHEIHTRNQADVSPDDNTDEVGQLLLLTLLSRHARVRGMILELRNKTIAIRHESVDRTMLVQSELSRWANDVHDIIQDRMESGDELSPNGTTPIPPCHRTLLSIMQHESLIALNRPLLASKSKTPTSHAALQACIASSRAILDTITTHRNTQSTDQSNQDSIMVWPQLTWSVWMSSFILTYAALEGVTTTVSARRYAEKALRILKQLSKRVTTWPDSCAQAVGHLVSALERRQEESSRSYSPKVPVSAPFGTPRLSQPSSRLNARPQGIGRRQDTPNMVDESSSALRPVHVGQMYYHPASQESYQVYPQRVPEHTDAQYDTSIHPNYFGTSPDFDSSNKNTATADTGGPEWLDPLLALDFSNFAQGLNMDHVMGFGFANQPPENYPMDL